MTEKNDLLKTVGACAERKFSNLLRFENGFEIRRKTEKFWQIEKKIGYLNELDNFKQKFFFEKKFSK